MSIMALTEEMFSDLPTALTKITESEMSDDAKMAAFMVVCQQQNQRDYASVTGGLIEGYQHDIAELRHELNWIRRLITMACSKPWTPSTAFILDCLYPDDGLKAWYFKEGDFSA